MSTRVGWDVSTFGRPDSVQAGQDRILELIATGAPLENVLSNLARLTESQAGGICSILLLDQEETPREGAGRHFPRVSSSIPNGIPFGPDARGFNMAACRDEPVVVADFLKDPRWEDYRELVSRYGLRGCGSITKVGADIGYLSSAVILWAVVAPTTDLGEGALAGHYGGAAASVALGVGA